MNAFFFLKLLIIFLAHKKLGSNINSVEMVPIIQPMPKNWSRFRCSEESGNKSHLFQKITRTPLSLNEITDKITFISSGFDIFLYNTGYYYMQKLVWLLLVINFCFEHHRPDPGRRQIINLNLYFQTSSWCLKRFLPSLYKTFSGTTKKCKNKNSS